MSPSTLLPPTWPSLPRITRSNAPASPGVRYAIGWPHGSLIWDAIAYGRSPPGALDGSVTGASEVVGRRLVSGWNASACGAIVVTRDLARLALARSAPPSTREPTKVGTA